MRTTGLKPRSRVRDALAAFVHLEKVKVSSAGIGHESGEISGRVALKVANHVPAIGADDPYKLAFGRPNAKMDAAIRLDLCADRPTPSRLLRLLDVGPARYRLKHGIGLVC